MLQRSVSQATRNSERKAPQVCLDSFTKSEQQTRMIDEAGESSGTRYSISASNGSYEERPRVVRSADFVQQRPPVLHVQAGQVLERSTLPETHSSGHLSSHSSENCASITPPPSSSHVSSSESPDLRRAVTVEGDRAVFSEIMQIMTSAVRNLWIAEGVKSVDDLACLYTTPRQVCHHVDVHNLDDVNIDSAVQGWSMAKKWLSSWRRYNIRRRKRTELSPSPAVNIQVFQSRRFGKIRVNDVPRSSDSPIPMRATTAIQEPAFHPSSPAVL